MRFPSIHRKGVWVSGKHEPRLAHLEAAVRETAGALLRLAPERARGMPIMNNEANMKVAFDVPYEPRTTEQFPAWLAASAILHDRLSAEYAGAGIRFAAAGLVKLPVFHVHKMLRLLATGTAR